MFLLYSKNRNYGQLSNVFKSLEIVSRYGIKKELFLSKINFRVWNRCHAHLKKEEREKQKHFCTESPCTTFPSTFATCCWYHYISRIKTMGLFDQEKIDQSMDLKLVALLAELLHQFPKTGKVRASIYQLCNFCGRGSLD